jgi:MFS family permease
VPRRLFGVVVRAGRGGWRRLRDWNHSEGAESSGLAALVETHALQAMGDATITVALAGSLFFSVPTHEARSRVALYLLVTMAPFAVVAPILGPLLDKFRRGRRTALALTMLARAVLAIVISHGLTHSTPLALYPAALGILVAGKAYSIARSAALPRLVPERMTLVQANARITITGVVAPGVAAAIAVGVITVLGHRTELELGAVVYCIAALFASRLPALADGARDVVAEEPTHGGLIRTGRMPVEVSRALRTAVTLRWLSGFLLLFGAFVVRVHPLGHLSANVSLAELAVGIGIGNIMGTSIGPRQMAVGDAARRDHGGHRPGSRRLRAVHDLRDRRRELRRPGGGEAVAGRHHPARRRGVASHLGLRALRDHAAAGVGRRRRDRDPATDIAAGRIHDRDRRAGSRARDGARPGATHPTPIGGPKELGLDLELAGNCAEHLGDPLRRLLVRVPVAAQ